MGCAVSSREHPHRARPHDDAEFFEFLDFVQFINAKIVKNLERIYLVPDLPICIKNDLSIFFEDKNSIKAIRNVIFQFFRFDIEICNTSASNDRYFINIAIELIDCIIEKTNNRERLAILYLYLAYGYLETGRLKSAFKYQKKIANLKIYKKDFDQISLNWLHEIEVAFAAFITDNNIKAFQIYNFLGLFYNGKNNDIYNSYEDLNNLMQNPKTGQPKAISELNKSKSIAIKKLNTQRVLIYGRSEFITNNTKRPHEVFSYLTKSLDRLEIKHLHLDYENILLKAPTPQKLQVLESIASKVILFKPNIVIYDDFMAQGIENEIALDFGKLISKLSDSMGFCLIGLYLDSWMPNQNKAISNFGHLLDYIWIPTQPNFQFPHSHKLIKLPMPRPPVNLELINIENKINRALFRGTIGRYNLDRANFIHKLREKKLNIDIFISNSRNSNTLNDHQYLQTITNYKANINFSERPTSDRIITGRVWETLLARSILIEEDNEQIKYFLTPYFHYIPFNSVRDIEIILDYLDRNIEKCKLLIESNSQFISNNYHSDKIWRHIFYKAFQKKHAFN